MKNIYYYNFPLCRLGIAEENKSICNIFFITRKVSGCFVTGETSLVKEAAKQLNEYFHGKRRTFDLPLVLHGTDFQVTVWKALQDIPYGEARSYKELAAVTGNIKACRAVGMANNRNPISVIIPCHRVIGHDGGLTGYAGGLEMKRKLLELEGFKNFSD